MTISQDFINYMVINGILEKESFYDYYINKPLYIELYDYLNKLINLDKRIDLDKNLQNSLIEIDKYYLPQIILIKKNELKYKYNNINIIDNNLKRIEDFYKFQKEKVYDKLFIEKAKIKIEEQDKKISSLKDEIDEMKKIIETLKKNLLNLNYQYY
jgi:hypothetical protein